MEDIPSALQADRRPPSAPYGQACIACSKAKTRCVGRGPDSACERCRRLSRQCQASAFSRKGRTPKRSRPNNSAALEQKLDALVNLLTSRNSPNTGGTGRGAMEEALSLAVGPASGRPDAHEATRGLSPLKPLPRTGDVPGLNPESTIQTEDEECLQTFLELHVNSFPFVHIPPGTTPSELRREKPLLWQAITAICCKSAVKRRVLESEFRSALAQRYVVELERSMDILLGLIAYVSWLKGSIPGQRIMCSYSSMVASLVFDLRLDRVGRWALCKETESTAAFTDPLRLPLPPVGRTSEERRAAIAAYCTCATVQSFLRTPPMRWTPHLQDSLDHLSKQPEVFGDEVLAAIARALRIGEDVIAASGWRFFEPEAHGLSKPPPMVHVKALSMTLENLRQSLRPVILENKIVQSYLLSTEASINELPLQHRPSNSPGPSWINIGRSECFQACIEAIRQLFKSMIGFTPRQIFGMHTGPLLHYAQAAHMAYRLSMAPYRSHSSDANAGGGEPMWDSRTVRTAVDLPAMLEITSRLFLEVPAAVGLEADESNPYTSSGKMLSEAKTIWSQVFEQADGSGVVGGASVASGDVGMTDGWLGMDEISFLNIAGDFWMNDVVGI